jgi:hypothetical protein
LLDGVEPFLCAVSTSCWIRGRGARILEHVVFVPLVTIVSNDLTRFAIRALRYWCFAAET